MSEQPTSLYRFCQLDKEKLDFQQVESDSRSNEQGCCSGQTTEAGGPTLMKKTGSTGSN